MTRRKSSFRPRQRVKPGAPPGILVRDPGAHGSSLSLIAYDDKEIIERGEASLEDLKALKGRLPTLWLNVVGLADIGLIQALGDFFGLHGLALEDVVNVHQRPKVDEYDDHVFVVTRMVLPGSGPETEQVSMFLGEGYLLTFQERPGDCFDPLRERLRRHKGRIRQLGPDYLAYALIDAVVDAYFPVLEGYGDRLETLEDEVVGSPGPELVAQVHGMKRDLLNLRRAIWPHREMINSLIRDENPLVSEQTRVYLRDCYDHSIQLMDIVETFREIASGLIDVYLSSVSTRLNDIMKVLTIIATIFMPMSFIAGLYGMNFDTASPWNMPELHWRYGYLFALGLMALSTLALLAYFLRHRWVGSPRRSGRESEDANHPEGRT